ncbi:(2Fe-2S)-binding domain protein [Mycobacterium ulcerans str. Harvey]|uniref:(2Fe-2S)-binding domain protein n=1 Tax=Mycobacterium ulcerans str. Harvey TaxID=1299332 RepID=A0ABP3AU15_MYCUL|nr:(2Fe-2S)-binding domain protein [Mycobacterium ulcerans str. Harvey]
MRMLRPEAMTAGMVQDFTGTPSTSTTQVPQLLVSQPQWVPVSRS